MFYWHHNAMPVFWICHICRSHPWHREHGRRTAGKRPSLAYPVIFSVTIAEQPPRLTCGATGYHYDPPPVVASSLATKAVLGRKRSLGTGPAVKGGCGLCVVALSPASLAATGTYLSCWIFSCQGALWQGRFRTLPEAGVSGALPLTSEFGPTWGPKFNAC